MFESSAGPCNETPKPKYDRTYRKPVKRPPYWKGNTYTYEKEDNLEIYLKKLGIGKVLRRMARELRPIVELTFDDKEGTYTFEISTDYFNYAATFILGEIFDDETLDGRIIKSTYTLEEDTLTQVEINECGTTTTIVREFGEFDMTTTLTHGDITATRYYKSVKIPPPPPEVIPEEIEGPFICPPPSLPPPKDAIIIILTEEEEEEKQEKEKEAKEKLREDQLQELYERLVAEELARQLQEEEFQRMVEERALQKKFEEEERQKRLEEEAVQKELDRIEAEKALEQAKLETPEAEPTEAAEAAEAEPAEAPPPAEEA